MKKRSGQAKGSAARRWPWWTDGRGRSWALVEHLVGDVVAVMAPRRISGVSVLSGGRGVTLRKLAG